MLAAVVAALTVFAGAMRAAADVTAASCGKLLPPAQGAYFGAKPGWGIEPPAGDDAVDVAHLDAFESAGRPIVLTAFSQTWHDGLPFPAAKIHLIWSHGEVPIVRIFSTPTEDFGPTALPLDQYPGPITHSTIVAGQHDAEIKAWADAARATNIPIGIDYDPEMNNAHPWGGRFDGGKTTNRYGDPSWPDGPELFRDAFRHIVTIFRQEGATNVTFYFQVDAPYSYVEGSYSEPFERYHWYYPGDDYVDWIGFSIYGLPNQPDGSHESFEQKLQTWHDDSWPGAYADLTSLSSRPLAINEMGFFKMPSEQAKADWVAQASAAIQSGRYPRIGYIHWWGDNQGADFDAWPASSPTFQAAFKAAFDQPFFDAKPQFSGNCLPGAPAKVTLRGRRLAWSLVPNATAYEIWLGRKRVARATGSQVTVGKAAGAYRVRGLNPVGAGPFATARR